MRVVRAWIVLAAIAAAAFVSPPLRADDGAANDPDDSPGKLDFKRVSHRNDDESVTYRIDTYEDFDLGDIFIIRWDFDFTGDGTASEACIILKRLGTTPTLRGGFFGDCGPETWATADAERIGSRALEITFPLVDLVEGGGLRDDAYDYRVTATDADGAEDTAPQEGLVAHGGVPQTRPREGAADTQLGYGGRSEGQPGRRQVDAEAVSGARDEGPLAGIPIIGNLCSGPLCFAVGVGAPFAAAAVAGVTLAVVRRRRAFDVDGT